MGRDSRTCHICGINTDRSLQRYHYNRAKRDICDKYGMYVYVCYKHFDSLNMGYGFGKNEVLEKIRNELKDAFINKHGEELFNELFG